jgi:predicted MFS family arabinose efflux permease
MTGHSPVSQPEPVIMNPRLLMLFAVAFGGLGCFYLLLSVVPLYTAGSGGGELGAGLVTGVMMLATVLVELAFPQMLAWLGYRAVMGLGLVLLGAPALALAVSPAFPLVLAVSAVRGAGLGIIVVAGSALTAELAPAGRRGEALAIYGAVVGVPAILGVPAGIWLSEHLGFPTVFVIAAVVALLPLAAVMGLPARSDQPPQPGSVLGALRIGGLAGPTVVFTAITFAAGVFATFLPLAAPANVAALALLVQAIATAVTRLAAGRIGDRHGSGRLIAPAVSLSALGAGLVIWVDSPFATILGTLLFGVGFGGAQNATIAVMIERVDTADYGRISALWNLAFDAGFGIGAVGFGLVVGMTGYPTAFALTAAVLLTALVPALLDRKPLP